MHVPAQTMPRSKGWRERGGSIRQSQNLTNLEEVEGRVSMKTLNMIQPGHRRRLSGPALRDPAWKQL